uniref:Transmembrane protein 41B n=1 Tax=Cyprinus carpio TaxID=7962 RepID=A0A8C2FM98_CYPCA
MTFIPFLDLDNVIYLAYYGKVTGLPVFIQNILNCVPKRNEAFTDPLSLQTFAIPGSIFLSILSGYLYPFPLALFLVCLCSGLGASFCYMLSYLVGRPMVYKYLTERAEKWSQQVDKHREHLINYIIFLRITPFLPNWFINITSPVINVPLGVFFLGTFLGVAPPSFVAINAGTTLYKLTTAGEAVSWNS